MARRGLRGEAGYGYHRAHWILLAFLAIAVIRLLLGNGLLR